MRRSSALIGVALVACAGAAEAAERHRLDLPRGRLSDAVLALGRQARISIGIRDPALTSVPVPAVRGQMSVEEALKRMLAGSGARAVQLGKGTWVVVRAPPPPPPPKRAARKPVPVPEPRVQRERPPAPEPAAADIVVTASKRRTLLASYPGAATIVDGEDAALEGLRGSDALVERVPGISSTHLGTGRNKLFIRGIADSSFNGPTQATVGQYLGETRINYNAPDPDLRLYDIQRVEVLPGPQGTLYGAGSLGGIIRIVPNPPRLDTFSANVAGGASMTQHGDPGADLAGMINVPIVEGVAALRLVGYGETEGGYIDVKFRGEDVNRTRTYGGRASLRISPGDGWRIDIGAVGQRTRGEDAQFADFDAPPLTRENSLPQDYRNSYLLGDLVVSKDWGDMRLVTAFGGVRQTLTERYDSTLTNGPVSLFQQHNRITMFSSDTRLSREGERRLTWVVGSSFVSNDSRQERLLGPPGALSPIIGVRNAVWEATAYGEATLKIGDGIALTGGGRVTHSRITGAALDVPSVLAALLAGVQGTRRETNARPSFAATARVAPGVTLFARYQQGFRPGGLAVIRDLVHRFRTDDVATLEAGLRWNGPAFEASASAAWTRWNDIQADIINLAGLPTTSNIGDGRIYTAEARVAWRPVSGLAVEVGAMVNDSLVTNPAPSIIIAPSSPLPNVAKINARAGVDYRARAFAGFDLRLSTSARYVGKSRLGIGPVLGEEQGGWLDTRVGARLESERQAFSLTVTNLADEVGNRFAFGSPFTLLERRQVTPLRPRTIRLGWEYRF